jgi:hypothetical protein
MESKAIAATDMVVYWRRKIKERKNEKRNLSLDKRLSEIQISPILNTSR